MALVNLWGFRGTGLYILVGEVVWSAVVKAGVHATL
ncbi:hypothetical protein L2D97_25615, partial [Salmonella enterica subsp. enterica serovar Weltevreden]|nr:hypothetical protein [Salmonella enterica subsp. enterica serovar Weltevreden]